MEEVPKLPLYMHKPKNRKNYEVRITVKKELRPFLNNKINIFKSLGKANYDDAIRNYPTAIAELQAQIDKATYDSQHHEKSKSTGVLLELSDEKIKQCVNEWFLKIDTEAKNAITQAFRNTNDDFDEWHQDFLMDSKYTISILKGQAANIRYAPDDRRYSKQIGYYNEDIEKMVLAPAGISGNLTLETYEKLNQEIVTAEVEHETRNIKRFNGNFIPVKPYTSILLENNVSITKQLSKTLQDVVTEFTEERKVSQTIKAANLINEEKKFQLIADYFAKKPITKITRQDIIKFVSDIQKLPRNSGNMKKQLAGRSIPEIIKLYEHDNSITKTSFETAVKYYAKLRQLLQYAQRNGYINNIAFSEEVVKTRRKKKSDKRKAFTENELKTLFHSSFFQNQADVPPKDRDARFYTPFLSLYHSLRREECCQILVSDVRSKNGIVYLNIEEGEEGGEQKSLKNTSSNRIVSLHPELIKLGFLDKVLDSKKRGEALLFHELKRNREGKLGAGLGRWFTRYRKTINLGVNVEGADGVFHSLRHSYRSHGAKCGIPKDYLLGMGGWTSSDVGDAYFTIDEDHLPKMLEEISKLQFDCLDLSKVYPDNPTQTLEIRTKKRR